jgi:hypothetical protein
MMKLNFFIPLLLLGFVNANAQIANLPGAANDVVRTKKYIEYEGSPYLVEEWSPGTLTDSRGQVYTNVMLRYDSYKKNVEVSSTNGTLLVSAELYPKFTIQLVDKAGKLANRSFSAKLNPNDPDLYLEELATGRYEFLKQFKTEFVEETVTGYGTSSSKKVFTTKITYFVKLSDGLKAFKLSKSSLIEAVPSLQVTVENFTSTTRTKLKSEGDFVTFFEYVNSLGENK